MSVNWKELIDSLAAPQEPQFDLSNTAAFTIDYDELRAMVPPGAYTTEIALQNEEGDVYILKCGKTVIPDA